MKKINNINTLIIFVFLLVLTYSCKPKDEGLQLASYSTNPEVFIDDFSPGLQYAVFGGAVLTSFDVVSDVTYNGSAQAMQFAVPDANSPEGTYAGGVFFLESGRDLSSYTALTFYAKASKSATLDLIGFGNDLGENKYDVSMSNVPVNTNWQKYYIPIPDPSKLTAEKGMLYYAEGPENGLGYTFWIDEVKFENIGTIAHPQASIMGGDDVVKLAYQGIDVNIENVSYTINLPNGTNQEYNLTRNYFTLHSSNEAAVAIDEEGEIDVVGNGLALITAKVGEAQATGTLTLNVLGDFVSAPTPTQAPENVISLFSDHYTNVPVDFFNGYWEPFQTTISEDFTINNDNVLNYVNFNFVGTQFSSPTVDASAMTHIHFDIFVPGVVAPTANLKIILRDFGADGTDGGGDDSNIETILTSADLTQGTWNSIDIPLSGLNNKNKLGLIIYEGTDLPNFYADNIFFYN